MRPGVDLSDLWFSVDRFGPMASAEPGNVASLWTARLSAPVGPNQLLIEVAQTQVWDLRIGTYDLDEVIAGLGSDAASCAAVLATPQVRKRLGPPAPDLSVLVVDEIEVSHPSNSHPYAELILIETLATAAHRNHALACVALRSDADQQNLFAPSTTAQALGDLGFCNFGDDLWMIDPASPPIGRGRPHRGAIYGKG